MAQRRVVTFVLLLAVAANSSFLIDALAAWNINNNNYNNKNNINNNYNNNKKNNRNINKNINNNKNNSNCCIQVETFDSFLGQIEGCKGLKIPP